MEISKVKLHIGKDEIDEAIAIGMRAEDKDIKNEFILFSAKWAKYNSEKIRGTSSFEEENRIYSNLVTNIMSYLIGLESISKGITLEIPQQIQDFNEKQIKQFKTWKTYSNRTKDVSFDETYFRLKAKCNDHITTFDNAIQEIEAQKYLIIRCIGGGGKTSLMRFIYLQILKSTSPVFLITLRNHDFSSISIKDYLLKKTYFKNIGEKVLDFYLQDKFFLLLDGLDEIKPNIQRKIILEVQDLKNEFEGLNIVYSTRPNEGIDDVEGFSVFDIQIFSWIDIVEFINQSDYKLTKKDELLDYLKELKTNQFLSGRKNDPFEITLRNLIQRPLYLSFYLKISERNFKIKSISRFFYEVFRMLFADADKLLKNRYDRGIKSTEKLIFDFFGELSMSTLSQTIYAYDRQKLKLCYDKVSNSIDINFDDFLFELTTSICLLNYDGEKYSFPHRSFSVFFAMKKLISLKKKDSEKYLIELAKKARSHGDVRRVSTKDDLFLLLDLIKEDDKRYYNQLKKRALKEIYYKKSENREITQHYLRRIDIVAISRLIIDEEEGKDEIINWIDCHISDDCIEFSYYFHWISYLKIWEKVKIELVNKKGINNFFKSLNIDEDTEQSINMYLLYCVLPDFSGESIYDAQLSIIPNTEKYFCRLNEIICKELDTCKTVD